MSREKYNAIQELRKRSSKLTGKKRLAMVGQGDFPGGNNPMRHTMNNKHKTQHLTIDNPEFPFMYDGKENLVGKYSSFYNRTDKDYELIHVSKKYNELLKGRSNFSLYFLYCKDDDSYLLVERKEVENLTENFGFSYRNEYLDQSEVGDMIPKGTVLNSSTSYDDYGNVSMGVNGRILYAVHPAVQDDAIIISRDFSKKMVNNDVKSITIPISKDTVLVKLYDNDTEYQGLPNIGDTIKGGIIAATRIIKEERMFSDLRDSSLKVINHQTDQPYFVDDNSEVIDINIYNNNPNMKMHKVNKQLIRYYNDQKWFYTDVYKICKKILKSGSEKIDPEINRWMRLAMNYLDTNSVWAYNDDIFTDMMVEILVRKKETANIGRKITGRDGNKTVICQVWPDEHMPYLTTEIYTDEYNVVHPKGVRERVDLITNPNAIINRSIPMVLFEGSVSFVLDRARKYANTLKTPEEQKDFLFKILRILNPKQTKEFDDLWEELTPRERKIFIKDSISIDAKGLLMTNNGIYYRWEAFCKEINLRDALVEIYEKYGNIITPYHIFIPKPKWGRDIYVGQDCVGYQYILLLKQSGEKGFSVRSSGSISDEGLPEKSNTNKTSRSWHSSKPIRFGEYETPNFMIVTDPNDFALITALYRASVDGRRWMYEAILSETGEYNIPDSFTSRTSEILEVYLKSLGIRMQTIMDEDEYIGEAEHSTEIIGYTVGDTVLFCTPDEMYYLKKMHKVYKYYLIDHPSAIDDIDEVWDFIIENLPFKKKHLTDNIIELFRNNIDAFSQM